MSLPRDRLRFADPRYRSKGYEVDRCLFNERLTGDMANRLTTILSIIKQLQGLDFQDGLAFLVQLLILVIDFKRAQHGQESILFGPTFRQFDWNTEEGKRQLSQLANQPLWRLKGLFDFWDLLGGRHAAGFATSPDGSPGKPAYFCIPPIWLSMDKVKEIYGDKSESLKIPMLVQPIYKPLAESLLNFYQTNEQAGVPLHLHFSVPGKANQAEGAVEQYVFRQDGNFWTIIYQGKRLPPMRSKSLRYIAFLLGHPRQAFKNAIEFVSAVEKQDARFIMKLHYKRPEESLAASNLSQRYEYDTGHILDAKAKRAVEHRRDELLEKLEAQNFESPERAAEMRQEVEQLKALLTSTATLSGKIRKSGDPYERARKAVSQAIHRNLKEIAEHHPGLANHLRCTLTPITYPLRYEPDQPIDWMT